MKKFLLATTLLLLPVSFAEQTPTSNLGSALFNNTKSAVIDSTKKTAIDSATSTVLGNSSPVVSQLAQQSLSWENLSNLPASAKAKVQEIYNSFLKGTGGNVEQARSKTLAYLQTQLQKGTSFINPADLTPTTPGVVTPLNSAMPGSVTPITSNGLIPSTPTAPGTPTVSTQKFEAIQPQEANIINSIIPALDTAK